MRYVRMANNPVYYENLYNNAELGLISMRKLLPEKKNAQEKIVRLTTYWLSKQLTNKETESITALCHSVIE